MRKITQHSKLEDALEAYNKELERTLDKLVPAKKKSRLQETKQTMVQC